MPDFEIPESWQLDSGLREDMVISIHSAYFAPHADYQDGKVLMLWLIGTDENEEPVEVRMSVGADWQTDDGNVITHPTKRKQHINKNSIYGHWIGFCFEITDLAKVLVSRGDPTDARIWNDLILHLQLKEISFGRNLDPQERLMPTEYFGLVTDSVPATPPPAQPTPPPAPPAQPAPAAQQAPALSPQEIVAQARANKMQDAAVTNGSPLYLRAVEMAKEAPDFATFVGQAFDDADILADDDLAERCADQSQVWATAHAS
jgi:hypothetical protein